MRTMTMTRKGETSLPPSWQGAFSLIETSWSWLVGDSSATCTTTRALTASKHRPGYGECESERRAKEWWFQILIIPGLVLCHCPAATTLKRRDSRRYRVTQAFIKLTDIKARERERGEEVEKKN